MNGRLYIYIYVFMYMCVHEYLELIGRIMCAFSPISPDLSDFPGDFDPG